MSCLPRPGGSEKETTDILISYLNDAQETQYEYVARLDMIDRSTPQPETLYIDRSTRRSLVVEQKSISWPQSYVKGHQIDHSVARLFLEEFRSIEFRELYALELPSLIEGTRTERSDFVRTVASTIRAQYS